MYPEFASNDFFITGESYGGIYVPTLSALVAKDATINFKVSKYCLRFQKYRKISNIRCTKSPNLNDPHLALHSSLPNPLKPGVKSRMKMKVRLILETWR